MHNFCSKFAAFTMLFINIWAYDTPVYKETLGWMGAFRRVMPIDTGHVKHWLWVLPVSSKLRQHPLTPVMLSIAEGML